MEPIYMLCGKKGLRYVRRFNSLAEAQLFAVSYAAEHEFSGQCLRALKPNQMVLFKNLEHAIDPMDFDDFSTIGVSQQEN